MTIVCATHFTDSSLSAVGVAAQLARKRREPLFLINVQQHETATSEHKQLEVAALDTLKLEAAALASPGLEIGTAVLHGPLGSTVWRFCRDRGAQLLVAGDTHHLTSALFESSLDQFACGVDVPLLVVREEKPLLSWLQGAERLKVMLALDRTWTSSTAHDWISRLSEYGPLDLVACHIWWPATEYERRSLPHRIEAAGHQALEQAIRREVETALSNLPANVKHRTHLEIGQEHVADRLLELSVKEQVDMFVVGTHPDSGALTRLWSVSRDVLGLAPMSVVCVPTSVRMPTVAAPPAHPQLGPNVPGRT